MSKTYKVGVFFNYNPEGEHKDAFEGMTEEEIRNEILDLAYEDISRLVYEGNLYPSLDIEVTEDN